MNSLLNSLILRINKLKPNESQLGGTRKIIPYPKMMYIQIINKMKNRLNTNPRNLTFKRASSGLKSTNLE
jgi:hypothetical protein